MKIRNNLLLFLAALIALLFVVPPLISAPNTMTNILGLAIFLVLTAIMYTRILRIINLIKETKYND